MNKVISFLAKAIIVMLGFIDVITLKYFHAKLAGQSKRIIHLWIKLYKL